MLNEGDLVRRYASGTTPEEKILMFEKTIDEVDDEFAYIYLGDKESGWKFDRRFGYEVDEDLGWGVQQNGGPLDGTIVTGTWVELVPTPPQQEVADERAESL